MHKLLLHSLGNAHRTRIKQHLLSYHVFLSLCSFSLEISRFLRSVHFYSVKCKLPLEFSKGFLYNRPVSTGRCDGIGRRDGLKIRWWRYRVVSSPCRSKRSDVCSDFFQKSACIHLRHNRCAECLPPSGPVFVPHFIRGALWNSRCLTFGPLLRQLSRG